MLFATEVVSVNNKNVTVQLVVLFGFLAFMISLLVKSLQAYSGYIILAVVVSAVLTVGLSKDSLEAYTLEDEFFVNEDHLIVSNLVFPFSEIADLDFHFKAFRNMRQHSYDTDPDVNVSAARGTDVYGVSNIVSFQYKKQTFRYQFYVQNHAHFLQFVAMLEQLYVLQVNFTESNWNGKTFMMGNVNAHQYHEKKSMYH